MKKIMLKIPAFLFAVLLAVPALGQSLSMFGIDTTNFPTVSAKFFAYDSDGSQIGNFNTTDFELFEDGKERTVTSVSCPPFEDPKALSSVLTIDVSGSMSGQGLHNAKEAAKAWINGIPLGKSECALTTFNSLSYLINDFTTDRNKLLQSVDALSAGGGTNFDAAYWETMLSGLEVAKRGQYKRVMVFLSDGAPNSEPQTQTIINLANQYDVEVYCVTLNMSAPQCLKDIADATGGQWYENVTTEDEARNVYLSILNIAQNVSPCDIEWLSDTFCSQYKVQVEAKLKTNNAEASAEYVLPSKAISYLELKPSGLIMWNVLPGESKDTTVSVRAINGDFIVSDISGTNPLFTISPKSFTIKKDEEQILKITYSPTDSLINFCTFKITNDKCNSSIFARGGYRRQTLSNSDFRIVHPNGGERFGVGTDTVITWEGCAPDEKVTLEYSTDNGNKWEIITKNATGLKYAWKDIPNFPSVQCLIKASLGEEFDVMTLGLGTLEQVIYSPDGTKLASCGVGGIFIWDIATSDTILSIRDDVGDVQCIVYSPDGSRIASGSYDNTVKIWDAATGAEHRTLAGHSSGVASVAWSPDASKIASGSYDGTVRIWNLYESTGISDVSDSVWTIIEPQSLLPDIIDMGKVLVGTVKDSVVTSFVLNLSDCDSRIDSIAIIGAEAEYFDIVSGKPPYILAPNQSRDTEFRFKPTAVGIRNAQIYVYTPSGENITAIRGEGVLPTLAIENKLIDFGKIAVGTYKDTIAVLTIRNTGSAVLNITGTKHNKPNDKDFTTELGGGAFSLNPGETHQMNLRFTANEIGLTNGTLDFEYNGTGSPAKILLVGEGVDDGGIQTNNPSFNLGEVCLGSTKDSLAAVLSNTGASPVQIDSTIQLGPDFDQFKLVGAGSFVIAAGATHSVEIEYSPLIEGISTCRYAFYHAGISSPEIIAFQAEGVRCELQAGYDQEFELFKPCVEENYVDKIVKTIINETRADIDIDSLVFSPDDGIFTITDNLSFPFTMADNEERDLTIRFTPVDTGNVCRTLIIYSVYSATAVEMEFCGFYGIYDWSVEPEVVKSYQVQTGKQREVKCQIINIGNMPLYWNNPPIRFANNKFTITDIDPNPTPANGGSEVTIQFTDEENSFSGKYIFTNNCDQKDSVTIYSISDHIYELVLKTDTLLASPGDIIQVPIYLTQVANDLYDVADGIVTELAFNGKLLDDTGKNSIISNSFYTQDGTDFEKHLSLLLPKEIFLGEKILLEMKVGLGDKGQTSISFNTDSTYISGFYGASTVTTGDGMLIINICEEGGDRLITVAEQQVGIIDITPNPAGKTANVNCYLLEDGYTSLILYNNIGMAVKKVYEGTPNATGDFSKLFDTKDLGSGVYYLVLRTPTQLSSKGLLIIK